MHLQSKTGATKLEPRKKEWFGGRYADLPRALRKGKVTFLVGMLILPIAGFFVFYVGVNFTGILLAFQQETGTVDGVRTYEWSLIQFARVWTALTTEGNDLGISVLNTMKYFVLDAVVMTPITFLISYYFSKKIRGYGVLRVLIFIPSMMSAVAVVTMYKNLIAFNGPLAMLIDGYTNPLMSPDTATNAILFYSFFFAVNGNVLLFQGALNRIPPELLDSAKIDGVSSWTEMTKIVVPLIMPTLATIVILDFTGIFNKGGPILVMTGGANRTSTIGFWIYLQTVEQGNFNMPAALGLCLTAVSLPIVFLVKKLLMPKESVEY